MASENCVRTVTGIEDALYAIGGKWHLKILIALFNEARRFSDIRRAVSGISAKVLISELRHLELNGFITRRLQDAPGAVHYVLTEYSKTLEPVIHALHTWGAAHRERIKRQWVANDPYQLKNI